MRPVHHPLTSARLDRALHLLGISERSAVVDVEPLGGDYAPVTRLRFRDPVAGAGGATSVVVKTRRVEGAGWGGPHHLRRELVALQVTAGRHGVAPSVLAADELAGLVVLTDLGRWPSLEALLLGADPTAARRAMVALGAAVGALHGGTTDVEHEHATALARHGTDARRDRLGLWPATRHWGDVVRATRELGFPDAGAGAVLADIDAVTTELEAPGPFGALVHLDLNPTNVVITDAGARLVDFEGSTFGHTGFDAAFLHFPFPNYSAHWAVLPADVVAATDDAYRAALAASIDGAADDETYARMLAFGAAANLSVRVQRLPVLAGAGQTPHDSWRRRAQLVQQIEVLVALTERAGVLGAFGRWFTELAEVMAERWADATSPPPPIYPAFASADRETTSPEAQTLSAEPPAKGMTWP